jgi:hypothetical protein
MSILDFFKKHKPITTGIELQKSEVKRDMFTCHYCQHQFEVNAKDIFPANVPVLYKDVYVQGKGVMCPKCFKTCIFG